MSELYGPGDGSTAHPLDNKSLLKGWLFDGTNCARCGIHNSELDGLLIQCGACKKAYYCSSKCWQADLPAHQEFCFTDNIERGPRGFPNELNKRTNPSQTSVELNSPERSIKVPSRAPKPTEAPPQPPIELPDKWRNPKLPDQEGRGVDKEHDNDNMSLHEDPLELGKGDVLGKNSDKEGKKDKAVKLKEKKSTKALDGSNGKTKKKVSKSGVKSEDPAKQGDKSTISTKRPKETLPNSAKKDNEENKIEKDDDLHLENDDEFPDELKDIVFDTPRDVEKFLQKIEKLMPRSQRPARRENGETSTMLDSDRNLHGSGMLPVTTPFQKQNVVLREAQLLKRDYGWEMPVWVLRNILRATPKGKLLLVPGRLAKALNGLREQWRSDLPLSASDHHSSFVANDDKAIKSPDGVVSTKVVEIPKAVLPKAVNQRTRFRPGKQTAKVRLDKGVKRDQADFENSQALAQSREIRPASGSESLLENKSPNATTEKTSDDCPSGNSDNELSPSPKTSSHTNDETDPAQIEPERMIESLEPLLADSSGMEAREDAEGSFDPEESMVLSPDETCGIDDFLNELNCSWPVTGKAGHQTTLGKSWPVKGQQYGSGLVPVMTSQEKEKIVLREAEILKREYGWEKPEWALRQILRATGYRKDLIEREGSLARAVNALKAKKPELPLWAVDPGLKKSELSDVIKKGECLSKYDKKPIGWEQPEWTTMSLPGKPKGKIVPSEASLLSKSPGDLSRNSILGSAMLLPSWMNLNDSKNVSYNDSATFDGDASILLTPEEMDNLEDVVNLLDQSTMTDTTEELGSRESAALRGLRNSGLSPEQAAREQETIILREAEILKREYGWEKPEWVLRKVLRATQREDLVNTKGSLARELNHLKVKQPHLPFWAIRPGLRKSDKSDAIKKGECLSKFDKKPIGWEKPEWTSTPLPGKPKGKIIPADQSTSPGRFKGKIDLNNVASGLPVWADASLNKSKNFRRNDEAQCSRSSTTALAVEQNSESNDLQRGASDAFFECEDSMIFDLDELNDLGNLSSPMQASWPVTQKRTRIIDPGEIANSGGARPNFFGLGVMPEYSHECEFVILKEVETLRKKYGWEIPEWVLKRKLWATANGQVIKAEGSLKGKINDLKNYIGRPVPTWAEKSLLKKSSKCDMAEQGDLLDKVGSKLNTSCKPEWAKTKFLDKPKEHDNAVKATISHLSGPILDMQVMEGGPEWMSKKLNKSVSLGKESFETPKPEWAKIKLNSSKRWDADSSPMPPSFFDDVVSPSQPKWMSKQLQKPGELEADISVPKPDAKNKDMTLSATASPGLPQQPAWMHKRLHKSVDWSTVSKVDRINATRSQPEFMNVKLNSSKSWDEAKVDTSSGKNEGNDLTREASLPSEGIKNKRNASSSWIKSSAVEAKPEFCNVKLKKVQTLI